MTWNSINMHLRVINRNIAGIISCLNHDWLIRDINAYIISHLGVLCHSVLRVINFPHD